MSGFRINKIWLKSIPTLQHLDSFLDLEVIKKCLDFLKTISRILVVTYYICCLLKKIIYLVFFKCSLEIRIEPFSGQWRRRDSRPLLSPEPDGGSRSREGSPSLSRGRSLLGQRRSSAAAEGGVSSSGSKDSSGECSREHSPQVKSFFTGQSFPV